MSCKGMQPVDADLNAGGTERLSGYRIVPICREIPVQPSGRYEYMKSNDVAILTRAI